jgi:GntR family transcriptional repressor for pyruvate dehydrogenase complex
MSGQTMAVAPIQSSDGALLGLIFDLVRNRGLAVGAQLPSIRELAELFRVKPTAVRDALLQAQAIGWVRILPRAGAFLRAAPSAADESPAPNSMPNEPNVFHLLDARRLLEIELAGRAAERRRLEDLLPVRRALDLMIELPESAPRTEYVNHDIRFHVEIARLAGNSVLFAMQCTLMEQLRPHLNAVPRTRERRVRTDRSHAAIYAALVAGDAESARDEMGRHLSLAYDSLLRDIREPPSVGKRRAAGA